MEPTRHNSPGNKAIISCWTCSLVAVKFQVIVGESKIETSSRPHKESSDDSFQQVLHASQYQQLTYSLEYSLYFLALPFTNSAGYLLLLIAILLQIASFKLISMLLAI